MFVCFGSILDKEVQAINWAIRTSGWEDIGGLSCDKVCHCLILQPLHALYKNKSGNEARPHDECHVALPHIPIKEQAMQL